MTGTANRPSAKVSDFLINNTSHTPIFYPPRELRKCDLANTEHYSGRSLTLPLYPDMQDQAVDRVSHLLGDLLQAPVTSNEVHS